MATWPWEAMGLSIGLTWAAPPSPELFQGLRDRGYAALGPGALRPWKTVRLAGWEAQGEGTLGTNSP